MFRRIQRLGTRAKELFAIDPKLLAIDPNMAAAAQMALTEATKSATIENPRQALSFFFDCFKPLNFTPVHKTSHVKLELLDRVFAMLQFRDATLPLSVALPIALYADNILNNFRFEPYHLGDIGHHFSVSSSLGEKARLVFNLVRAIEAESMFRNWDRIWYLGLLDRALPGAVRGAGTRCDCRERILLKKRYPKPSCRRTFQKP
jgi:hypothetical protein